MLTIELIEGQLHFGIDGYDADKVAEFGGVLGPYRREIEVL